MLNSRPFGRGQVLGADMHLGAELYDQDLVREFVPDAPLRRVVFSRIDFCCDSRTAPEAMGGSLQFTAE